MYFSIYVISVKMKEIFFNVGKNILFYWLEWRGVVENVLVILYRNLFKIIVFRVWNLIYFNEVEGVI